MKLSTNLLFIRKRKKSQSSIHKTIQGIRTVLVTRSSLIVIEINIYEQSKKRRKSGEFAQNERPVFKNRFSEQLGELLYDVLNDPISNFVLFTFRTLHKVCRTHTLSSENFIHILIDIRMDRVYNNILFILNFNASVIITHSKGFNGFKISFVEISLLRKYWIFFFRIRHELRTRGRDIHWAWCSNLSASFVFLIKKIK